MYSLFKPIPVVARLLHIHNMRVEEKCIDQEVGTKRRLNSLCGNPEKLILNLILCFFAFCFIVQVSIRGLP